MNVAGLAASGQARVSIRFSIAGPANVTARSGARPGPFPFSIGHVYGSNPNAKSRIPHNGDVNRLRAELRWTAQAAWRGLVELVNSNDLTHAASIAYYALLSLFPFLLLIISLLGSITASEDQRLAVLCWREGGAA
jgi:hypothetical protein